MVDVKLLQINSSTRSWSIVGILAGVLGTLTMVKTAGGVYTYTFTRTTAGNAMPVGAALPFGTGQPAATASWSSASAATASPTPRRRGTPRRRSSTSSGASSRGAHGTPTTTWYSASRPRRRRRREQRTGSSSTRLTLRSGQRSPATGSTRPRTCEPRSPSDPSASPHADHPRLRPHHRDAPLHWRAAPRRRRARDAVARHHQVTGPCARDDESQGHHRRDRDADPRSPAEQRHACGVQVHLRQPRESAPVPAQRGDRRARREAGIYARRRTAWWRRGSRLEGGLRDLRRRGRHGSARRRRHARDSVRRCRNDELGDVRGRRPRRQTSGSRWCSRSRRHCPWQTEPASGRRSMRTTRHFPSAGAAGPRGHRFR